MQHGHLRHVLMGSASVDRGQISWGPALVTSCVAGAIVFTCMQLDQIPIVFPLVVGAVFVGLANVGESTSQRMRTMAWCTFWATIATLLGGLVAAFDLAQVPLAIVIALITGFAGALGRRGALIGLLTLVIYVIFSGSPDTERTAITSAALLAFGGLLQLIAGGAVAAISNRNNAHPSLGNEIHTSVLARIKEHRTKDDQFARHAVRLAVAIGIATAIAQSTGWPHEYWIPMTVAWMARPDKNGTTTRVFDRTLGTIVGIGVSIFLIDVIGSGPLLITLYVFVGTLALVGLISANYPIAVVGITVIVITLFTLDGEPLTESAPYRVLCTLIAAVITIAASYLWQYKPKVTTDPE